MKNRPLLIILFSVILLVLVSSCEKRTEKKIGKKLDGTWIKANVEDIDSYEIKEWKFDNGLLYIINHDVNTNTYKDTILGEYTINANLTKRNLSITKCKSSYFVSNWTIVKLTNNYLSIYKSDNGREFYEFKKK